LHPRHAADKNASSSICGSFEVSFAFCSEFSNDGEASWHAGASSTAQHDDASIALWHAANSAPWHHAAAL